MIAPPLPSNCNALTDWLVVTVPLLVMLMAALPAATCRSRPKPLTVTPAWIWPVISNPLLKSWIRSLDEVVPPLVLVVFVVVVLALQLTEPAVVTAHWANALCGLDIRKATMTPAIAVEASNVALRLRLFERITSRIMPPMKPLRPLRSGRPLDK